MMNSSPQRFTIRRWFLVLTTGLVSVVSGCTQDTNETHSKIKDVPRTDSDSIESSATNETELTQQVQVFCGACHAVPLPDSFPKDAWYDEVKRGFNFYYDSGRKDLTPPSQASVVRWYRQRAPEQLVPPDQLETETTPLRFDRRFIDVPVDSTDLPAVSVLRRTDPALDTSRVWGE